MCILITIVMKDLWNEICFDLSECKRRNVLEKDYENAIVQCLAILGWKKYLGEIATQYPIQVGHETKLADIVVSSGGTEQFVIEVKRPGHTICPEDERQMFSYMRLLKHQVMFGLYIGDDIRLYYDDRSSQSFPEPLFIVNISKDNPDGVRFVELFAKESFDIEKLQEFCRQKKEDLNKEQRIREEVEMLLSGNGEELFRRLYCEDCISRGLEKDFADRVLEKIVLTIRSRKVSIIKEASHPTLPRIVEQDQNTYSKNSSATKKHWHYTFNGKSCPNAGKLAFEIVKKYTEDHPGLTYNDIVKTLPQCIRYITKESFFIKKEMSTDSDFTRRWSVKFAPMLISSDDIEFAIHTGWNYWGYGDQRPYNICEMIEFARKQGYTVTEL